MRSHLPHSVKVGEQKLADLVQQAAGLSDCAGHDINDPLLVTACQFSCFAARFLVPVQMEHSYLMAASDQLPGQFADHIRVIRNDRIFCC